eukprot:m.279211 g.279211  ORF g.279211 m.279211 type:complete len:109 (-) comp16157_c2_seq5:249-575(-)
MHQGLVLRSILARRVMARRKLMLATIQHGRAVEIARKSYASTIASDIIATSISWSPLAEAYWLLAADIEQQQDNISEVFEMPCRTLTFCMRSNNPRFTCLSPTGALAL